MIFIRMLSKGGIRTFQPRFTLRNEVWGCSTQLGRNPSGRLLAKLAASAWGMDNVNQTQRAGPQRFVNG